eukprot:scaffold1249_cov243-Pinguiococcus_pyrenoidosus.AAC.5
MHDLRHGHCHRGDLARREHEDGLVLMQAVFVGLRLVSGVIDEIRRPDPDLAKESVLVAVLRELGRGVHVVIKPQGLVVRLASGQAVVIVAHHGLSCLEQNGSASTLGVVHVEVINDLSQGSLAALHVSHHVQAVLEVVDDLPQGRCEDRQISGILR